MRCARNRRTAEPPPVPPEHAAEFSWGCREPWQSPRRSPSPTKTARANPKRTGDGGRPACVPCASRTCPGLFCGDDELWLLAFRGLLPCAVSRVRSTGARNRCWAPSLRRSGRLARGWAAPRSAPAGRPRAEPLRPPALRPRAPWRPRVSPRAAGTGAGPAGAGRPRQGCRGRAGGGRPRFAPRPGSGAAPSPALAALLPWRLRALLLGGWSISASPPQCHGILNFPRPCLPSWISQLWLLWLLSRFVQLHCCGFSVLTL